MISGIILASGFSSRMGEDKLLITIGRTTIIQRVIHAATAADLDEIILVYRRDALKRMGDKYRIKTVKNNHAATGQSAAVKTGVRAASKNTQAYVFMVGDQPLLDPATINLIIGHHRGNPTHIILPTYRGKRGNPVLFPSVFRKQLLQISGDKGGITVINNAADQVKQVEIGDPHIGVDVDTLEDLNRIKNR